jgi:hypothetical protein
MSESNDRARSLGDLLRYHGGALRPSPALWWSAAWRGATSALGTSAIELDAQRRTSEAVDEGMDRLESIRKGSVRPSARGISPSSLQGGIDGVSQPRHANTYATIDTWRLSGDHTDADGVAGQDAVDDHPHAAEAR